jgi:hypothetical protein
MDASVREELAWFRRGTRVLAVASLCRHALLVAQPCLLWWLLLRLDKRLPAQQVSSAVQWETSMLVHEGRGSCRSRAGWACVPSAS